jgi:hypothetical protein
LGAGSGSVFGVDVVVGDVELGDVELGDVELGDVELGDVELGVVSRPGESTTSGLSAFRADATSELIGPELRPKMYPIAKNTPISATTMKNTLNNWRFPKTNSNSPSSFFGTRCFPYTP